MKLHIAEAIAAHKTWVDFLNQALERRETPDELHLAGYDDMCKFGKWLYSLDDTVKITQPYRRVKDLHYRFHQEAEQVVEQALNGDFTAAGLLSKGGFANTSAELVRTMEAWQAGL